MTQPSYKTWTVRTDARPETVWSDGQRFETGAVEPVVTVFDPRGWTWEVTLNDDRSALATLAVTAGPIDQKSLRVIPLNYLLEVAQAHVRVVDAEMDRPGMHLEDALEFASTDPGEISRRGDPPTPEEFARAWHATPEVDFKEGERITRRRALAKHFGVTVWAIDKWTRKARDSGKLLATDSPKPGKEQDDDN